MKNILVTGGAGYIGSHTLRILRDRGYSPVCLDNLSTGHRYLVGDFPFIEGDLADPRVLERAFSANRIEAVIHFASLALVEESCRNPYRYYHENIGNALRLLEAMRRHGVRAIVFSSSCAAYGIPARVPIDEASPLAPLNPYGATKMMVERILRDYDSAFGIRFVALRYFNAAGAQGDGSIGEWHEPETHLIPRLLEAAGSGGSAHVYGTDYPTADGTCVRDYIHVTDLGAAHVAALELIASRDVSEVCNLGTGKGSSVLQVVQAVKRVTGNDFPVEFKPRRPGDPPALVADPRKGQEILAWRPEHSSLQNIVETAWAWHRRRASILSAVSPAPGATD